ncbi:hypothetical protein KI387_029305, partial [Taxus chinensis]
LEPFSVFPSSAMRNAFALPRHFLCKFLAEEVEIFRFPILCKRRCPSRVPDPLDSPWPHDYTSIYVDPFRMVHHFHLLHRTGQNGNGWWMRTRKKGRPLVHIR